MVAPRLLQCVLQDSGANKSYDYGLHDKPSAGLELAISSLKHELDVILLFQTAARTLLAFSSVSIHFAVPCFLPG